MRRHQKSPQEQPHFHEWALIWQLPTNPPPVTPCKHPDVSSYQPAAPGGLTPCHMFRFCIPSTEFYHLSLGLYCIHHSESFFPFNPDSHEKEEVHLYPAKMSFKREKENLVSCSKKTSLHLLISYGILQSWGSSKVKITDIGWKWTLYWCRVRPRDRNTAQS